MRILQGKLEREKSRTGEEIARLASQKGAGGRRGELTSEISPQVDDKVLLMIFIVLMTCTCVTNDIVYNHSAYDTLHACTCTVFSFNMLVTQSSRV